MGKNNLILDCNRTIYKSLKYDITIIELKDTDNINKIDKFLELDDNLFN